MKKKMRLLLVFGMLFLLLTGCGESEKVISGNVNNKNSGNSANHVGKTEDEGIKDAQGSDKEQEKSDEMKDTKGFVFISDDVQIVIDAEAEPIVEALGEPKSYFEAASCAFEGLDKIYTYSGFEVNTYPLEDGDYISSVILKDDTVTTPEGLAIGDSKDKIAQFYGDDCTIDNNLIVYEKDNMKLRIILKDDEVAAIEYVSNVLE